MKPFELLEPNSIEDACELLSEHADESKLLAGGVALVSLMKQRIFSPRVVINLAKVEGLDYIRWDATKGLLIGAKTTLREVETSGLVREKCPHLVEVFSQLANVRVRNMATLGGNLCHADPHSDPPPALINLQAKARLASSRSERIAPLADFFRGYLETSLEPDEILTEVIVPPARSNRTFAYLKHTHMPGANWPTVGVSAFVELDGEAAVTGLGLAIGAVMETPVVITRNETSGIRTVSPDALFADVSDEAFQSVDPPTDLRGSGWYKKELVKVLTRRALGIAFERGVASH